MDYSVNSGHWGAIFAVPDFIVDNYIKLINGSTLKVLLFLLRNNSIQFSNTEIASAIGVTEENVDEAFCFLEQTGIFSPSSVQSPELVVSKENSNQQPPLPAPQNKKPDTTKSKKPTTSKSSAGFNLKPTEIAERIETFPDIKSLMEEAERCLNHQLTPTETTSFIWIYEYLGLSIPVILMLVQYCVSIGKTNPRYIETVAIDWQEKGITTFEEAQSETKRLNAVNTYNFKIYRTLGINNRIFSVKEQLLVDIWRERNYSLDMINLAYNKCVDNINNCSIAYMSKILDSWYNNGVLTTEQISSYLAQEATKKKPVYNSKKKREGNQLQTYHLNNLDQLVIEYIPPTNEENPPEVTT